MFAGISIKGDITRLQRSYDNVPAVQTTDLAAAIGISGNAKTLSDVVLWATGRSFDKPPELRTSDWEKRPLSPSQLAYAALNVLGLVQVVSKVSQQPGPIKVRVVKQLIHSAQSDAGSFTVEKIVGWKTEANSIALEVKWLGYEDEDNTYEPFETLSQDVRAMVKDYLQSLKSKLPLIRGCLEQL